MRIARRKLTRAAAGLAVVAMAVLLPAHHGGAGAGASPTADPNPLPIECIAGGVVHFERLGGGTVAVRLEGSGTCVGDLADPYELRFRGVGTASAWGLCTSNLVVRDLAVEVDATFSQVASGFTVTQRQLWAAPVSTNPFATPYAISHGGEHIGAGNLFTRIFFRCPPEGSPAATFQWVQSL